MTTAATAPAALLDLRDVAPRERHAQVFERFDALRLGQVLELLVDHDPQPLRVQLERRAFGALDWTVLEAGPAAWRVQVGRRALASDGDSCCSGGACCS